MKEVELLKWCKEQVEKENYITFPDEVFDSLTEQNSKSIIKHFGSRYLMKLPAKEIKFFEWLKENDPRIWNDLWNSDEEQYIVSVNFLPLLLDDIRGFPICDLLENDNYYFTASHMVDKESDMMKDSVQKMYMDKKQLTVEQTLVLEISIAPIDIWRFCYRYKINLDRAKQAVANLVEEGILVHLKDAEHLANFVEF